MAAHRKSGIFFGVREKSGNFFFKPLPAAAHTAPIALSPLTLPPPDQSDLSGICHNSLSMKIALMILLVILAVLACGCTATAPSATPAAATPAAPAPITPNLAGTWIGTMLGYEERIGFTDYDKMPITMVVTEQQGRLFSGYLKFGVNSTQTLAMAGVIGRDGKTFAIVENINGYTTGELIGTDTIELTHVDDADPYSVAIDTLKRV